MAQRLKNIAQKIGVGLLVLLGLLVVVYLIAFAVSRLRGGAEEAAFYKQLNSDFSIMAHQAGEGEYPSNSLIGFKAATDIGIQILDMDVFETKDQQFILFHDQTLDYRTDGTGRVDEKTLAELQEVNFAHNWSQDGGQTYPYRDNPVQVTTLNQVFDAFPTSLFNIEIKQVAEDTVTRFCDVIKDEGLQDSVLVSSNPDNPDSHMDLFRTECPDVATVALESEATQFYILHRLGLAGLFNTPYTSLQVPEFSGDFHVVTEGFVNSAHRVGLAVHPWTINTVEDAQRFKDMGADGINTDFPNLMISSGL